MRCEKIGWRNGIVISTSEHTIILDPVSNAGLSSRAHVFVTHAHADHTYGLRTRAQKHATGETLELYRQISQKAVDNQVPVSFNRRIRIGDIAVRPLNAGHMLGSAQFLVELPERTVLYTGDINCVDTLTTTQAKGVECDVLITEATYGNPFYIFPNRQQTYAKIVEWITEHARKKRTPTFQVYAAGKAQEVVKIINEYTRLQVLTSPTVSRVNKVHTKYGVDLEYVDLAEVDSSRGANVCVTTYAQNACLPATAVRATATGWALGSGTRSQAAFPLSSHADFRQLVEYAKSTKAKRIYVYTGYADLFCEYLSKRVGVPAEPLPTLKQTELLDF